MSKLPVLVSVLALAGCHRSRPVVDFSGERVEAKGTLSGTVRGPEKSGPVAGRKIEAAEVSTGRRYAVETNATGGFTFLLPPGTYRLEVALNPGEVVLRQPEPDELKNGDIDAGRNIELGGSVVSSPTPSPSPI